MPYAKQKNTAGGYSQKTIGPRGLGTPAQEKMALAQKPRAAIAETAQRQKEFDKAQRAHTLNSPSTPWSPGGRKNRRGG